MLPPVGQLKGHSAQRQISEVLEYALPSPLSIALEQPLCQPFNILLACSDDSICSNNIQAVKCYHERSEMKNPITSP